MIQMLQLKQTFLYNQRIPHFSSPRSYVSLTFPRNISFHCILGTVSFSHEDKLLTGKYVKTVLYQGRTFYIVVYKLRASNKNSWPRQED